MLVHAVAEPDSIASVRVSLDTIKDAVVLHSPENNYRRLSVRKIAF